MPMRPRLRNVLVWAALLHPASLTPGAVAGEVDVDQLEAARQERLAQWFEEEIGFESRITVLGHIQRGGNPTVYDRLMAFNFVTQAIDGLLEGNKSSVICYNDGGFNHKKKRSSWHILRTSAFIIISLRECCYIECGHRWNI